LSGEVSALERLGQEDAKGVLDQREVRRDIVPT
jgi:hypothetical protein